ncbi:MAG: hypothetical protein BMS9Abin37_1510 [Acidobacteriota bacterium]|nr:MAG: hypothetical protein BMS9Abin37_1510 [Acidobacteriota bacterium]
MKRAERHHLKQDEFVHWLDKTMLWGLENQRNIVNATLVIVGAGLLLGGLYIYRSRQAATADALLTAALEQFHGTVVSGTGAAPSANVPTFASADERYRTSLEAFEVVTEGYGTYSAGRHARYYVGLCHAGLSELDAAEESLEAVRSGNRDLLYYLATRALASVKLESDDPAGAADLYRTLVEDTQTPLPKDYLLFELAKTEERAGNLEQAQRYYERMLAEHPASQLRGDAMTRSETLALATEGGTNTSD